MRKLALEGLSFAGKTTVGRELERYNPERYKLIQEYVVYAGSEKNFPDFPPKNKQEALRNLDFFLNLERKRHEDMAAYKGRPYVMVMDRSVISLLGFRFVQKHFSGIDIFAETKEIIKGEPQLAPDHVIYMQASDAAITARLAESQRRVGDLFIDPEFNSKLRQFFDWLIEHRDYPIVTIDTDKPLDKVKREVKNIADSLDVGEERKDI